MKREPNHVVADLPVCPRCGEKHEELVFEKLTRPVDLGAAVYGYWASCPVTGEPLIFHPGAIAVERKD